MNTTTTRIEYFDWLRTVAICCVVVLHVAASDWYSTPVASWPWQALNIADGAVRFAVPVFFMVSGALFLSPARHVTPRSILSRSLPRLAVPFIVWSAIYAVISTFGPHGDGSWPGFIVRTLSGHYHLWFLIALAGLYLVTPLLRLWSGERALLWYFIALATIFTSVLPLAADTPILGPIIRNFLDTLQLHLVLGYSMYFVLGYLLSTQRLTGRIIGWLAAAGVAGIAATIVGTSWLSSHRGAPDGTLYGYLTPNVAVVAIAIFCSFRFFAERSTGPRLGTPRGVTIVAGASMGIYLVHPLFQGVLAWAGWSSTVGDPVVMVPLLSVGITTVSLIAALLIRRIPVIGRWIS